MTEEPSNDAGLGLWLACVEQLSQDLPEQQFNTWIKPLTAIVAEDFSKVTVYVANRFKLDWIRAQYAARISGLLEDLYGHPVALELALAQRESVVRTYVRPMQSERSSPAEAPTLMPVNAGSGEAAPPAFRNRLNSALTFETLVHHARHGQGAGRAVYSFCMCPGGTVVAATSEAGRVVTNGMSQYSRAERNANAGMVVGIGPKDFPRDRQSFIDTLGDSFGVENLPPGSTHPLAGVVLQRQLEARAYQLGQQGGAPYAAPAQRVGDFLAQRPSTGPGSVHPSYKPGVHWCDLHAILPPYASAAMREALPAFGRKIRGYDMPDAVLTGLETRTSSPIHIRRGDDLQSLNLRGLYPAGEGAGYAGGILSAAVDGIRVGEAVAQAVLGQPMPLENA